jgi:integrase
MPRMIEVSIDPTKTRHKFRDGLAIFRRPKSPYWWIDVNVAGVARIRKSSESTTVGRAYTYAERVWMDAHRQAQGLPPLEERVIEVPKRPVVYITVGEVMEAYAALLLSAHRYRDPDTEKPTPTARTNAGQIRNWIIPFWREIRIDGVSPKSVADWQEWRQQQVGNVNTTMVRGGKSSEYERKVKRPAPTTMNREWSHLGRGFKIAVENQWIAQERVPTFSPLVWPTRDHVKSHIKASRRPAFSPEQRVRVYGYLERQTESFEDKVFGAFAALMMASGLRTGEAHDLRFRDLTEVSDGDIATVMVTVRGAIAGARKTGKREVFSLKSSVKVMQDLKELYEQKKISMGADDYVFRNETGKKIAAFDDLFKKMIETLQCTPIDTDEPFSVYSFRHTYATYQLENGIDRHDLAENMGTSVKIINQHYGHVDRRKNFARIV